ncbi:MAG: hypothetical protein ACOYXM_06120 [Actinomycetota bacterium]
MVLALASFTVLSRSDEPADQWVVAVHADSDRTYDEPCLPMDEVTELEATSASGEYNGLLKVSSRADGDAVVRCYEAHGIEAELRIMTASDRETWDEVPG